MGTCDLSDKSNFHIFDVEMHYNVLYMQTIDILRKQVSFYESLRQRECASRTLFSVLNDIRKGVYADVILKIREHVGEKRVYLEQKRCLPSVCFCGIFGGGHYKHDMELYTNLLVIDIDHVHDNISAIRRALVGDPKIVAVWTSVSGQGLKALVHVEYSCEVMSENLWVVHEKCAFPQVLRYLKKTHRIRIDPIGRDITRHCFMSFDPDIFLRKEFEPFKVNVNLSEESMSEIRTRYVSRKYPLPL